MALSENKAKTCFETGKEGSEFDPFVILRVMLHPETE